MSIKKIVMRLDLSSEKTKRKAMTILAAIEGVDTIKIHANDSVIIVIGNADPVLLASSLRKLGFVELVSVKPYNDPCIDDPWKQNSSYVIFPASYDRYSNQPYYVSDDDPNPSCTII